MSKKNRNSKRNVIINSGTTLTIEVRIFYDITYISNISESLSTTSTYFVCGFSHIDGVWGVEP